MEIFDYIGLSIAIEGSNIIICGVLITFFHLLINEKRELAKPKQMMCMGP